MSLRQGAKGAEVIQVQLHLVGLGYNISVDGDLGPQTMGALQVWLEGHTVPEVPDWLLQAVHQEYLAKPATPAGKAGAVDRTVSKLSLGAYAGNWPINNPKDAVALAVDCGLERLHIMVNDHSTWRTPQKFGLCDTKRNPRNRAGIVQLANGAHDAGLEVHITSWMMPHHGYIMDAAVELTALARECRAHSIDFDAEEPWIKARKTIGWEAAAQLIRDAFSSWEGELGADGIKWTKPEAFKPISDVVDYYMPQAYATRTTWEKYGVVPETVVPSVVKRWRTEFGEKRLVLAMAAYRQTGIAKHTPESAMRTVWESAQNVGAEAGVYWQLRHIKNSKTVQKIIGKLAAA